MQHIRTISVVITSNHSMHHDAVRSSFLIWSELFLEISSVFSMKYFVSKRKEKNTLTLRGNPESKNLFLVSSNCFYLALTLLLDVSYMLQVLPNKYTGFFIILCLMFINKLAFQNFSIFSSYFSSIVTFKYMELATLIGRNKHVVLLTYSCQSCKGQNLLSALT